MHRYLLYFFLFCGFVFSVSCKKEKLKSPKASFLVVDHVSVKTILNQGTGSHKITDIWYYVDGQFKGVFPIGSVMPIVATDNAKIMMFAGIKNNGISSTRVPYPFYNSVVITQTLQAGKTYTISPEFEYSSGATFYYAQPQDFDTSFSQFQSTGDSSYVRITDPTKTFGGTGGSIFMSMSDAKPTSKMVQSTPYYLPSGGSVIYLELNYKCNQAVTAGVIGGGFDEREAITLSDTKGEWNKIYIQLTSIVSTPPIYPLDGYQVFIKAVKKVNTPEIYIDNIKLISE
jgi:hypothetical protein